MNFFSSESRITRGYTFSITTHKNPPQQALKRSKLKLRIVLHTTNLETLEEYLGKNIPVIKLDLIKL